MCRADYSLVLGPEFLSLKDFDFNELNTVWISSSYL